MNIRPKIFVFLKKKYPDKMEAISTLYMESDFFQSLCDDYYDCFKYSEEVLFKESTDKIIENEYVSLMKDLERDISEEMEKYEEFEKHK